VGRQQKCPSRPLHALGAYRQWGFSTTDWPCLGRKIQPWHLGRATVDSQEGTLHAVLGDDGGRSLHGTGESVEGVVRCTVAGGCSIRSVVLVGEWTGWMQIDERVLGDVVDVAIGRREGRRGELDVSHTLLSVCCRRLGL
jgi:hypothetical protein